MLGTAEALVSTGDIGLIRDDSLRSAIVAYLDKAREGVRGYVAWRELLIQQTNDFGARAPIALIFAETLGPAALDSLDRADNWMALAPPGVPLPAFDTYAFVRDPQTHQLMVLMTATKDNMAINRREMHETAVALREQVDAALAR